MRSTHRITAGLVCASAISAATAITPIANAQMNTDSAEVITNGPQTDPGDRQVGSSARQNVSDSKRYESLLRLNPNFRAARERKECGPIDDPQMHADCVASFG